MRSFLNVKDVKKHGFNGYNEYIDDKVQESEARSVRQAAQMADANLADTHEQISETMGAMR